MVAPGLTAYTSPPEEMTHDGRYVVFRNVALLDEHRLPEENGQPAVNVGPRELHLIAKNGNDRIARTGDATPIVIGHTKDGEPETEAPPLVGYVKNFAVNRFARTGNLAVFGDLYVQKQYAQLVKDRYPRRSPELWVNRMQIDPLSLLGASSPERDLGLLDEAVLRYQQQQGGTIVRYGRKPELTGRRAFLMAPTGECEPLPTFADVALQYAVLDLYGA